MESVVARWQVPLEVKSGSPIAPKRQCGTHLVCFECCKIVLGETYLAGGQNKMALSDIFCLKAQKDGQGVKQT